MFACGRRGGKARLTAVIPVGTATCALRGAGPDATLN